MTTTDYQKQAADFCERFGVTIKATRYPDAMQDGPEWATDDKPIGKFGFKHGLRYRIVLSRKGKADVSFDYWGSIADREALAKRNAWGGLTAAEAQAEAKAKREPSPYSVLACISGDIHCPETFEDFCAEYGYDEDSRKAEATFRRVFEFAKELRAFFATDEEREALAEIS